MSAQVDVLDWINHIPCRCMSIAELGERDTGCKRCQARAAVAALIAERDALLARLERPASEDEEQHAREFLAAEYEKDGKTGSANHIRTQPLLPNKARAVRAIAAALRQQPAPALDDAMADQIIKGNADLVPAQHQTMGEGHE